MSKPKVPTDLKSKAKEKRCSSRERAQHPSHKDFEITTGRTSANGSQHKCEYKTDNNIKLCEELDPKQQEVVTTTKGPLLVFAGAGSGKTKAIIYRTAYLIRELGIPPWKILIVTFTNKAAKELRERLSIHFSIEIKSFWVGTFHSICAKILRIESGQAELGFDANFTIYDSDDSLSLIRKIYKDLNISKSNYPHKKVYGIISKTKNSLITPEDFFEIHSKNKFTKTVYNVYAEYQKRLRENNSLDFDDLLVETAYLLHRQKNIKDKYNLKFDYIMIDEYQDTNYAQFRIVRLLSGEHGNVCVVGDDDQAIYSWRGATIKNILNFASDFKEAKVIRLEQNYRSTQPILNLANRLIANNAKRHPKVLWSKMTEGRDPILQRYETDKDEVQNVLQRFISLTSGTDEGKSTVVLYRTNAQSRMFETACIEHKIPYKVHGSLNFFQRKEIKDIIAYLRVLVNPYDLESLLRIINFPPRGIGKVTINKLIDYASRQGINLYQAMQQVENIDDIKENTSIRIKHLVYDLKRWSDMAAHTDITDLLEDIVDRLNLFSYYENCTDHKDIVRLENSVEFMAAVKEYAESFRNEFDQTPLLGGFLQNISLWTTLDNEYKNVRGTEGQNILNLMTLHNAKGLEFDNVFIVGLEEKLLPHILCSDSPDEIEEERRLLYVGMTRAKKSLYLSYTKFRRSFYGYEESYPSRFIKEMYSDYSPKSANLFARLKSDKTALTKDNSGEKAFRIGQRIEHNPHGKGTVLGVDNIGKDIKLTINFDSGKLKKVMGKYVQYLTKDDG